MESKVACHLPHVEVWEIEDSDSDSIELVPSAMASPPPAASPGSVKVSWQDFTRLRTHPCVHDLTWTQFLIFAAAGGRF